MTDRAYLIENGKLDPAEHDSLLDLIESVSRRAGVTPEDVAGVGEALSDYERDYLRRFRRLSREGTLGLVYAGPMNPGSAVRCRWLVGALTRNWVEARLIGREEIVTAMFDGEVPAAGADLAAVPDAWAEAMPPGGTRVLQSWIAYRAHRRLQTVLAVPTVAAGKTLLRDVPGAEGFLTFGGGA